MILVTGAGGTNGREIVKRLSQMGAPVRAMLHKPPEGAQNGLPGVEFVIADFNDATTIRQALQGIDRAFLVTNSSERVESQQLGFVDAARAAGVRQIVYLSQLHADRNSPVRFLRYHAVVEDAIRASGITFAHLRPNLYMQALLGFRPSIISDGRFFAPVGDARVSIVDVRDIAAVAVAALTESGHEGKTYNITGPEAVTHTEIGAQLSEALGKHITFVDIAETTMREGLLRFGFPAWQADGLVEDYGHYRRGEAACISTGVDDVTGVAPRTFREFAADYKEKFLY
jgi:uncharacterized protein YbjT (DUF2867 family)